MAYTVQLKDPNRTFDVRISIMAAIKTDGRFVCGVELGTDTKKAANLLLIKNVRRIDGADYCGQHPGQCNPFGRGHYKAKYLEWKDWISFHEIVNDVLDSKKVVADAWTNPREPMRPDKKKFWVRRDNKRRVQYDFEETFNVMGIPFHTWNSGTQDQFKGAT